MLISFTPNERDRPFREALESWTMMHFVPLLMSENVEFVFRLLCELWNVFAKRTFTCVLEPGGFITTMLGFTCCWMFKPCFKITNDFCCGTDRVLTGCCIDPVESWRCGTTSVLCALLQKERKNTNEYCSAEFCFKKHPMSTYVIRGVICWRTWGIGDELVIGLITVVADVLWGMLVVKLLSLDDEDVGGGGGALRALKTACCSVTPRKPKSLLLKLQRKLISF